MKKYKTVQEYLEDLDSQNRAQVGLLREIILNLGISLQENIKWNAPNYVYSGIDRITFNTMNKQGKVKLIIHMGTSIKEDKKASPVMTNTSLDIFWNSNIRGTVSFDGIEDIKSKKDKIKETLIEWLKLSV